MRRSVLSVIVLTLALVAAGCGDDDDAGASAGTSTTTEPTTEPAQEAEPDGDDGSTPTTEPAQEAEPLIDLGGFGPPDAAAGPPSVEVELGPASDSLTAGWTMFNARSFDEVKSFALAVDETGEIAWSIKDDGFIGDLITTSDDTVIYVLDDRTLREVDAEGRVVRDYTSAHTPEPHTGPQEIVAVDVENFHHEVAELPNGNLLAVASEFGDFVSDVPLCGETPEEFTGEYLVIGDRVVEIDRANGDIVWSRSVWDTFDPMEFPGSDLCNTADPLSPFPERPNAVDWTHVNAAELTPDGNAIILSARHLDTIWAWPYGEPVDAEPLWIVGEAGHPLDPADAFWHQHAPEQLPDGNVLLYDNGANRVDADGAFVEPPFSRVMELEIDAAAGTADVAWTYTRNAADGSPIYAAAVGDVDRLDNGNTLIVDGFLAGFVPQIVEIDPEDELARLITLGDGAWIIYRAEQVEPLG